MTPEEQLEKWVAGESIHDHENDQCCPDFSCCRPDLAAHIGDREIFQKYFLEENECGTMTMLTGFLMKALENYTKTKVHIVSEHGTTSIPEA